jgi:GT2 family glycosyltransferase
MAVEKATDQVVEVTPARRGGTQSVHWSAAVINFNGEDLVCDTIGSIKSLAHPPNEILLIDDGSTDRSVARVRDKHPDVQVVSLGMNTGRPNVARNRALREARHRYVLVSDNDVIFAPDAVSHLMEALLAREDAAVCTPLIVAADDQWSLLGQGHLIHFLCWSTAAQATTIGGARELGMVRAAGCGIQMIDKLRATMVGFLDERMALGWGDDGEFHFRIQLAGFGSYTVPDAIVFHRRVRTQSRFYGQVHNRWRMLLKDYEWRTLLVAGPALLVYEVLLVATLLAIGAGQEYARAMADVAAGLPEIMQQRRMVQAVRQVADSEVLCAGMLMVPRHLQGRKVVCVGLAALTTGFRLYWSFARRLLHRSRSARSRAQHAC